MRFDLPKYNDIKLALTPYRVITRAQFEAIWLKSLPNSKPDVEILKGLVIALVTENTQLIYLLRENGYTYTQIASLCNVCGHNARTVYIRVKAKLKRKEKQWQT
jgi:hypothetical protein